MAATVVRGTVLVVALSIACGPGRPKSEPDLPRTGTGTGPGRSAEHSADDAAPPLPEVPDHPMPVPGALFAVLSVPDTEALLSHTNDYLTACGLPGRVERNDVDELATELFKMELHGLDLGEPLWVLAFDPRESSYEALLVGTVKDEAALREAVEEVPEFRLHIHGDHAAIGVHDMIEKYSPYALSTVTTSKPPRHPGVSFYVRHIVQRFAAEIDELAAATLAELEDDPDYGALRYLVDGVEVVLRDIETARVEVQLDSTEVEVIAQISVRDKTGLAQVISKQKPATYELLADYASETLVFGGHFDWATVEDVLAPMYAAIGRGDPDRVLTPDDVNTLWWDQLSGDFAVGIDVNSNAQVGIEFQWHTADPKKLRKTLANRFAALLPRGNTSYDLEHTRRALSHRRVSVGRLKVEPKASASQELKDAHAAEWKYPLDLLYAVAKDRAIVAMGNRKTERIKKAIERVTTNKTHAPNAAIEASKKLKESWLMLFDVTGLAPAIGTSRLAKPGNRQPIALGIGFAGGDISVRAALPASQVAPFAPAMTMMFP